MGTVFRWGEVTQIDMRILVAVAPTMYREAFAHILRREDHPNDEVHLAYPDDLHREAASFRPHLIVCSDEASKVRMVSVPSWVVIRYHDRLSASVSHDWKDTRLIQDPTIEDLLAVVEESRC
jgi:hypothetical protein